MKTFITLLLIIAISACNGHGNPDRPKTTLNDGEYTITAYLLEGDCSEPEAFKFTVYKNKIYDAPSDPIPEINAVIIDENLSGLITYPSGEQAAIDGRINGGRTSGEWRLLDETCFGYFDGLRTDTL